MSDTRALASLTVRSEAAGITPIVVAMDGERDKEIVRALSRGRYPTLFPKDAGRLLALIRRARFTVCGRLHAAVLSASADTPYVGYDSDGRIGAFSVYSGSGIRLRSGKFDRAELFYAIRTECYIHQKHPYSERIEELRQLAREDIRALDEWITNG